MPVAVFLTSSTLFTINLKLEGEAGEVGKPLPNHPQGEGEARAVESSQRLVVRVRRFRVISCRDAVSVLSKCAGWCSVTSVCSVFKK